MARPACILRRSESLSSLCAQGRLGAEEVGRASHWGLVAGLLQGPEIHSYFLSV